MTKRRLSNDKVALVIGGTEGVGLGIVEALAADGAVVVATGRREAAGAVAVAQNPDQISFARMDAGDLDQVRASIDASVERYGRLDILVNNVGYALNKTVLETTEADFDAMIDLNLRYVFFATKHAGALMRDQGGGSIINIGSLTGMKGYVQRAGYCAAKGGVQIFTKAAALDLAPFRVRVNCVSPGGIDTPMLRKTRFEGLTDQEQETFVAEFGRAHPLGRIGRPSDIAAAVAFLASDAAEWITGTNLVVDGGMSAG